MEYSTNILQTYNKHITKLYRYSSNNTLNRHRDFLAIKFSNAIKLLGSKLIFRINKFLSYLDNEKKLELYYTAQNFQFRDVKKIYIQIR